MTSVPSAGLPAHPGTFFKEPDSGLPLKCDLCEDLEDPSLEEPLCVTWCLSDALTYEEREEEVEEEEEPLDELEIGLESLEDRYGLEKIMDTLARMSESKKGLKHYVKKEDYKRPWRM